MSPVRSVTYVSGRTQTNGTLVEPPEPEEFPESAAAIRDSFPGTDAAMVERVVATTQAIKPDATDADIREALIRTCRKNQESAALWLKTLPAFFAPRAGPATNHVCPERGGEGKILSHEFDGQLSGAWLDLPMNAGLSRVHAAAAIRYASPGTRIG